MTQNRTFVAVLILVSLAFGWVIWPLFGAVFWAVAFVIVFAPVARRVEVHLGARPNLAALIMVLGFVTLIILPTILILTAVIGEATNLVQAVQSGQINLHQMFQTTLNALPEWSKAALVRVGLGNLTAVEASLAAAVNEWIGANAPAVLSFGQNTAGVFAQLGVMLYLMFFLFRDGDALLQRFRQAIPMEEALTEHLMNTFTLVVRATVRGDILLALLQGGLGGLGFWVLGIHAAILWTVLMCVLALLPVFGAMLVWGPVAVYLMINVSLWQGLSLIAYGTLVISLVDNIARPLIVGQSTRMPDYVVLISTVGGIATFGLQGFVSGPVVAALFMAVWSTFLAQKRP